jgi:uncharacterized protein (DUF1499 family)
MSGEVRIQYSVSWQEVVLTLKVYLFSVPIMKILAIGFVVFLSLAAAFVLAGQLGFLNGEPPADLGVRNGRLKPPSATPNSVSSQAVFYPDHPQRVYATIAPLSFTGDADQAMQKLASMLKANERTVLVTQQPDYLYAQCSTPLLQFTDDVEFWLDRAAGVIQLRSASRLGHGDLGANRARIEKLRAQFLSQN